jgi:UrcA family protein
MNSTIKTRIPLALATLISLTSAWVSSTAIADEQVRSERVKFQDLNVESQEGVQALYARIHAAAKRVCSQSDPVLREAEGPCTKKSEANAIEKLNLSQLTAYYKIKTGEHGQPLVAGR